MLTDDELGVREKSQGRRDDVCRLGRHGLPQLLRLILLPGARRDRRF
jgi:hypothetical protein